MLTRDTITAPYHATNVTNGAFAWLAVTIYSTRNRNAFFAVTIHFAACVRRPAWARKKW